MKYEPTGGILVDYRIDWQTRTDETGTVLVTGGAGFIGAHICEHILYNTPWDVIVLDRLNYAGNLGRLEHLKGPRLKYVYHDFRAEFSASTLFHFSPVDYIIHNGAETHVGRSLENPLSFIESNVLGTYHVLQMARQLPHLKKMVLTSTDEVPGAALPGINFKEDAEVKPSNPYSASKAGAEAIAYAWNHAYGLPVVTSRTMNIFGERQDPEKFVPLVIKKVLAGDKVLIHGDANGSSGSRKWLYARNQADALLYLLLNGVPGEKYHIGGEEHDNLNIAMRVANALNKKLNYEIIDYHKDRPGHDRRYSLDDSKITRLGWTAPFDFDLSFDHAVKWTALHTEWLCE